MVDARSDSVCLGAEVLSWCGWVSAGELKFRDGDLNISDSH